MGNVIPFATPDQQKVVARLLTERVLMPERHMDDCRTADGDMHICPDDPAEYVGTCHNCQPLPKPPVKFIVIEGVNDYDMTTPEWAVYAMDGAWLATCESYDTASLLCDALRDKRGF